jgi:biotin carboxyl carrier protein
MAGLNPDARRGEQPPTDTAAEPAADDRREATNGDALARQRVDHHVAAMPATPADARAVRVRLAVTSRLADDTALRLTPVAEALRMTNPTVAVGPLGGTAVPEPPPADAPVLAQRHVLIDGVPAHVALDPAGHDRHHLVDGGDRTRVVLGPLRPAPGGIVVREVLVDGFRFEVDVEPERIASLRERATRGRSASAHGGPLDVRAIIPGKVVIVSVAPGDTVTAGQQLLVVEAMKMQNELRAPRDGTIDTVGVAPGVNIEVGDLLVVIS